MRKAISTLLPIPVVPATVVRLCIRPDCSNKLAPHRKKYCSAVCKNIVMTGGLAGSGQPTLYKPEYATSSFKAYIEEVIKDNKEELIKGANGGWTVLPRSRLPTKEAYALYLEVEPRTIYNWEARYPAFAHTMDLLIVHQKQMLLDYGLAGRMNPGLVKMILSTHGMIEKRDPIEGHISVLGIVKHLYEEVDALERENDLKLLNGNRDDNA